jgi:HEAT repeat protein
MMTAGADEIGILEPERQKYLSPDAVLRDGVAQALAFEPAADPARFAVFFRRLRRVYPEETLEAIIPKLLAGSLEPFTTEALEWVAGTGRYLAYLLDAERLSRDEALSIARQLRETDPKFLLNFTTLLQNQDHASNPKLMASALTLLEEMGAFDSLFWWLYGLTQHPDQRVRSKAAKAICEMRPKTELVKRQLQSQDARVRANAIEALWPVRTPAAQKIFRGSLSDPSHRVVMNALVGLYISGDDQAINRILDFAHHPSPLFQSAAAWALGCIGDTRGVAVLETLANNRCAMVRKRAQSSLASIAEKEKQQSVGGDT